MPKTKSETEEDIMNELTDLEYDDEELILLDDEELQPISQSSPSKDEDVTAFSVEPSNEVIEETPIVEEPKAAKQKKMEDLVPEELTPPSPAPVEPQKEEKKQSNIEKYLRGVMDASKNKEEAKVEKEAPIKEEAKPEEQQPEPAPKEEEPVIAPVEVTSRKETDDLDKLFNQVTSNIKGAADTVNKHVDIKKKIDDRILELQVLQEKHEENKRKDFAEINAYKDDVYAKLKAKKIEVEEEMAKLKQGQDNFEAEKQALMDGFIRKEKELQASYAERVKSLEQIEFGLVKRKEQLDLERVEIAKDREKYELDKQELAENLKKFNQLVDEFTKGVDRFSDNN